MHKLHKLHKFTRQKKEKITTDQIWLFDQKAVRQISRSQSKTVEVSKWGQNKQKNCFKSSSLPHYSNSFLTNFLLSPWPPTLPNLHLVHPFNKHQWTVDTWWNEKYSPHFKVCCMLFISELFGQTYITFFWSMTNKTYNSTQQYNIQVQFGREFINQMGRK